MKKIIIASSIALALVTVAPVFADSTSTATSTKKEEARLERRAKIGDRVIKNLEKTLADLKDIRTRISNRIAKLETAGGNVTEVKALLAIADTKIATAENEITALKTALAPYDTTLPKDKLALFTKSAKKAQEAIRSAHRALVEVIVHIRPGKILPKGSKKDETATSTATTTRDR